MENTKPAYTNPIWTDRDEKQLEELFPGMVTFHLDPLPTEGDAVRAPQEITAAKVDKINAMMTEATKGAEFKPVVEGAIVPGDLTVMCADTSEGHRLMTEAEALMAKVTQDSWMDDLAARCDHIARRARQIELPRLPNHAERTKNNASRKILAAGAPFQAWKCVRCGSEITTAEEAADHRRLNLIGRGACRRAARAIREEARAALGQKPKKRRAAGPWGYVYETPDRTFWPTKFEMNGATVSYDDIESHVRRLGQIPIDASPAA